jgi:hypothetical protein
VEFPRAPGLHIGVIFYELQAPLNEHSKIGKPNGVIGERTPYFEHRSCQFKLFGAASPAAA